MKRKGSETYLTITDAAQRLGISVSTLRRYIRSGTFPAPKREFFGTQSVAVFDVEDIEVLKKIIERLRGQ